MLFCLVTWLPAQIYAQKYANQRKLRVGEISGGI
jgi:hypothetical protein